MTSQVNNLEDEVIRLRQEVESYRQREVEQLRSDLAAAREQAAHYRSEALRNAEAGREIDAMYREKVSALETQVEALRNNVLSGVNAVGRRQASV